MTRSSMMAAFGAALLLAVVSRSHAGAVIYSCVKSNGDVHIVNQPGGCQDKEQSLSWSITGPAGPAGPQGIQGPQGPAGPSPLAQKACLNEEMAVLTFCSDTRDGENCQDVNVPCAPYACGTFPGEKNGCKHHCLGDADCAPGAQCVSAGGFETRCRYKPPAICDGDHTVT